MNFGSLMYAAQSNASQQQQDQVRCYKTTFAPPKKEAPKQRNLSANVQKFLARKEEEKRQKEIEEKRKRDELLSLRSQDKMSVKRVSTMLKRTKSANKSVMEDAVDDVNTVVTMAGPSQCDEDDYGYVSQEASTFYNKLMDKYSNMPPEEDKFSKSKKVVIKDLNAAKERVKATLNRIEEEEMLPRKRKRKSKEEKAGGGGEEDDFIDDEIKYRDDKETKKEEEEPKAKKPKRPAPPPMDFSQLLKIAEQKQYEPVVIEKKPVDDEDDKPMTKKQRLEYLREKEARIQRERRELEDKLRRKPSANKRRSPSPSENGSSRSSSQQKLNRSTSNESSSSIPRIPKLSHSSESGSRTSKPSSEPPVEKLQSMKIPKLSDRDKAQKQSGSSNSSGSSRPVPSSVAEELLKKSSNVWSKPCNLSPSNSPNHKVSSKLSSNGGDIRRNSLDNRPSASSNQNLDRRKDTPEKQLIKKPSSSSVSKPSSSDLDRRKELSDNIDREKLRKEIERKKLLMKEKLANNRNHVSERKDERPNRTDNQPSRKNESSTVVKNGIHKNNSIRNDDLQQKSRPIGDLQHKSRMNGDMQLKSRSDSDAQHKSRMNGDMQQKSRPDSDAQHKSRINGDMQQKSRSDSDAQHKSRMNGDMQQKSRSDIDAQQKKAATKGNKVLVDLFGDDFPNESNANKNNSNLSSSNKSAVLNGSSKLSGKPNPVKALPPSSSRDCDDRLGKSSSSSSSSSKNIDSKSKPSISSSQNTKLPNRPDDRSASSNKVQPRQFPPNDLKSKSQINDRSKSGDVKPRQFPPADVKPRQFPPADMRPRQFPPPDVHRNSKPVPRRRPVNEFIVTDDEDEYDSDMSDFIDDTDYGTDVNISKEISQIFGYDKKRYKNIDDDDIEEANFAQLMKEEVRSTRIGIQEDLEEYLRDKAEKKRAHQKKLQKLAEMRKKRR